MKARKQYLTREERAIAAMAGILVLQNLDLYRAHGQTYNESGGNCQKIFLIMDFFHSLRCKK